MTSSSPRRKSSCSLRMCRLRPRRYEKQKRTRPRNRSQNRRQKRRPGSPKKTRSAEEHADCVANHGGPIMSGGAARSCRAADATKCIVSNISMITNCTGAQRLSINSIAAESTSITPSSDNMSSMTRIASFGRDFSKSLVICRVHFTTVIR